MCDHITLPLQLSVAVLAFRRKFTTNQAGSILLLPLSETDNALIHEWRFVISNMYLKDSVIQDTKNT